MKIYIPLLYSEKVKRPDKKFFLFTVLGEDFIILLLAFSFVFSHPWLNAIGLFLLQVSFWCVYEIGYIENDIIGEKFEDKAVLSYNYNSYQYSFQLWQPWVWAGFLSLAGIAILSPDLAIKGIDISASLFKDYDVQMFEVSRGLVYWFGFLLILRFLFHIYNHINKQSRVWFYLLLQTCRYCGYLVLFSTNIIGLVLLISKILIRSIQYIIYRYMGGKNSDWPMNFPRYFFYLLIYLLILGVVALNERDISLVLNYQVLMIVGFCLIRGCKHFQKVFLQFASVSEDGSNRVV